MTPRRGGEAGKFGGRYEGIWTVRQLFEVLFGRARSLTVESIGNAGKGVEFVLDRADGAIEVHQVKRQRGNANSWTLRALDSEGVLSAARAHVEAGREFHFVSMLPARRLDRLSDRARRSADLQHFIDGLLDGKEIDDDFNYLSSEVWGSPQRAWELLRGIRARWPDERDIRDTNAALAGVLLKGAQPLLASLGLGDLIVNHLALPLTTDFVKERLSDYDLRLDPLAHRSDVSSAIGSLSRGWQEGIAAEMLDPPIPRSEAAELVEALKADQRLMLVSGNAGEGKSGVLFQGVGRLREEGWPVLAIRLDRLEPFLSPGALGEQLGLSASPVAALAALAGDRPALLLIDQLDAVSLASGRMPASFDSVAELLREAEAFPEIRVLLACREFDIDNDNRLRALVARDGGAKQFKVGPLSDEQVAEALARLGLDLDELERHQLELLRSPLHLVLLSAAMEEEAALSFSTTKDLLDLFWESKVRASRRHREPPPRFADVVDALVDSMSAHQQLVAPAADLDSDDLLDDADVLTSEHVLVRDRGKIAFFHEAFFDYAFARRWIRRGQSLVAFLLTGEQEFFRRAQVRQVLSHLREDGEERFVSELGDVLTSEGVRFHIKDVVIGLLRSLPEPTHEEWGVVETLLKADIEFQSRIWASLRTAGWFDRLLAEGKLQEWLDSGDSELWRRAVELIGIGGKERPDEVAALLAPHVSHPDYSSALLWVTRFADLGHSRALFDLVLEAVRIGKLDGREEALWLDAHGLGMEEPGWAVELLHAFFAERPDRLQVNATDKVTDLESRDRGLLELISEASARSPRQFSEALLPYLLEVMETTSASSESEARDSHFGYRIWRADIHEADDALLYGVRKALVALGAECPETARPLLESLEQDRHDAAQWLLYEGIRAAGKTYADWAGEILLQDESRLYSGYIDSALWTTRELLAVVGPHVSQDLFSRLEVAITGFAPDSERPPKGYSSFTLLSALPESRLSQGGRRRLAELRRKFGLEKPEEPMGIRVGTVGSPIPQDAARRMNDDQWLGAVARYSTGEREGGIELRGDAEELSRVLEDEAKREPERFARLASRFDSETHPAYANAVLRGVSKPEVSVDPETLFALVRHIGELKRVENDRWLGWALRGQMDAKIPDDIIELIVDRALHSPDPEREAWQTEAWSGQTYYSGDPWANGMNTARGSAAESLADLLAHDAEGRRSSLIADRLQDLSSDPSVAVRASVARLLAAALRFERAEAIAAFERLVNADDRLLGTPPVEELIAYVGKSEPTIAAPVIERMLASRFQVAREAGGRLAAFAGLELRLEELLIQAAESSDPATRKGVATTCAGMVAATSNQGAAMSILVRLFEDADDGVRDAAAGVALSLRDQELDAHDDLLRRLIASAAFPHALPQLLLTLEGSASAVDELGLMCAERFIAVHRSEMGNIETSAAGDSRYVGELLLRTYSQSDERALRSRALDLIDELLLLEAYGIADLVTSAER